MKNQESQLGNPEKNLIAMGAAMGAGCRKCADKLYELAIGMNIPERDMKQAFQWGLDAKTQAVGTMHAKMDALLGSRCEGQNCGEKAAPSSSQTDTSDKLMPLVRIASFVAANSAPDANAEIRQATADGIEEEQIRLCISIGKMIRKNAQALSDEEVEKKHEAGIDFETMCCSSSGSAGSAGCSCS